MPRKPPYKLPRRFDAVNDLRQQLLGKKYSEGLTPTEAARLEEVDKDVDDMLRPFHEVAIRRLKQMIAQTKRDQRKLDEISHRLGLD